MKLEIESVSNGYIVTIPESEYSEVERKFVVEEKDENFSDDNRNNGKIIRKSEKRFGRLKNE